MTQAQLLEIELQRRIDSFQKAVVLFAFNETLENSQRLANAKSDLSNFMIRVKL